MFGDSVYVTDGIFSWEIQIISMFCREGLKNVTKWSRGSSMLIVWSFTKSSLIAFTDNVYFVEIHTTKYSFILFVYDTFKLCFCEDFTREPWI